MPLAVPAGVAPIPAHQLLVFFLQVALLTAAAYGLGRAAARVALPAVVGELLTGVVLGPSLLGTMAPRVAGWLIPPDPAQFHLLDAVGQLGVVLLVGLTGVDVDMGLVRRRGLTAVGVSVPGLVVPMGLGVVAGFLLPSAVVAGGVDRTVFALFLGVAMGVSAIPVIAKTLLDMRLLHRNIGQLTLAAGTVDDVVAWLMLAVVSAMATTGVRAGDVALAVGWVAVTLLVAALAGRPLVGAVLRRVGRSDGPGGLTVVVVVLVVGAGAATQAMRLEAVLGAFVAGVVIGSSRAEVRAALAPLRAVVVGVLAPLFFATAGLRVDLTALARPAVAASAAAVLAVAVLGKFVGAYLGARLSHLGHWEALALGAGMNARGVVELVVGGVGVRLGVLGPAAYTIIVLVAIATSVMAPPILRLTMARVERTAEEHLRERAAGVAVPAGQR